MYVKALCCRRHPIPIVRYVYLLPPGLICDLQTKNYNSLLNKISLLGLFNTFLIYHDGTKLKHVNCFTPAKQRNVLMDAKSVINSEVHILELSS